MSLLSKNTKGIVHRLYKSSEAKKVCDILEFECGTEKISCEGWTPEQMERIRFAVLKLDTEKKLDLYSAIKLAQVDWRDLLISAGFAEELNSHEVWAKHINY